MATYVEELEDLIIDTLLPTYERYWKARGIPYPLQGINPELLKKMHIAKRLPALLRPWENET